MSIEIPEDVVCSANAGYDSVIVRGGTTIEAMRSALRAALEGWLAPKPVQWESSGTERVFIPEAPTATPNEAPVSMLGRWETTYYWRALLGGATKADVPPNEMLYALRKEPVA